MGSPLREDLHRPRVALLYDERMCQHCDPNDEDHPESPERIRAIWKLLQSRGITQRCVVLNAKEAEDKYIRAVHSQKHINLIRNISSRGYDSWRKSALTFNSIYFNEGSSESAYLAAGSVIEVTERVAKGEFSSAVAIVRPPGHHAEHNKPMGFCLFNNVAIAASYLLNERPELGIKKVLIVDWDVHHGNGTQKMFWKDPRVLFFSVHRFDFGTFYPSGDDGSHIMVGEGLGAGYNINVPWEDGGCGDADYFAVWDYVLIPVARAYSPDMVIISGGFDAAMNDPLGGCCVTPYGYSVMMKKLMEFAGGRIVMALEGGYNLISLANSVVACVETLLEAKHVVGSSEAHPFESTWHVIRAVRHELRAFWSSFNEELPDKPGRSSTFDVGSESEDEMISTQNENLPEEDVEDVVQPLMKLKINEDHGEKIDANSFSPHEETLSVSSEKYSELVQLPSPNVAVSQNWRSIFSKMDIWYACYGSNMWKPRFLCYIEGGQVEGMQRPCSGSRDRSLPNEIKWKMVPHRLFFGRSFTKTWGAGGAAFLHPESNLNDKAYVCLYRITLEQFNDVLLQENHLVCLDNDGNIKSEAPLFDLSALDFSTKNKSNNLEILKGIFGCGYDLAHVFCVGTFWARGRDGWYSNVVHLGTDDDLPILTMTCPLSHVESFRSGKLPLCAPQEAYVKTLVRGLVEGKQLSEEEALEYIRGAVTAVAGQL